jgi:hypothetical protein
MPIEPVSAMALTKRAQERDQRHAQDREIVAFDTVEQLHAAALHAEHADAIADLGPFGVKVSGDELL